MKYVMVGIMALVMSGCTATTMDFMEKHSDAEAHASAMKFLGDDHGTLVYKATEKSKQCLRDRIEKDGYYTIQADIVCAENSID
jgi:hypothetical protein